MRAMYGAHSYQRYAYCIWFSNFKLFVPCSKLKKMSSSSCCPQQNIYVSILVLIFLQELRAPIITLRSFDVETSLIEQRAKSEMLVRMRFQWWRDAVNSLFKGRASEQPTMSALAEIMQHRPLTRYRLQRIISTKEEEILRDDPLNDLNDLEELAEGIYSQLLYLQLEAAGIADKNADHAASHVGKAIGLAHLLKDTAQQAQRHRSFLPEDLCEKHGIDPGDLMKGEATQGLRDVIFEIASAAKAHLDIARGQMDSVPAAARPLLLPALPAGLYLSALEKCDFNVYDGSLAKGGFSPLRYMLELKYKMLRGQY